MSSEWSVTSSGPKSFSVYCFSSEGFINASEKYYSNDLTRLRHHLGYLKEEGGSWVRKKRCGKRGLVLTLGSEVDLLSESVAHQVLVGRLKSSDH